MTALVSLSKYRLWLLGGVGLVGFAMSIFAWQTLARNEEQTALARFQRRAEAQAHIAKQRIKLYEEMIHGLGNLFMDSENVSRAEFELVAADLLSRHQGVQALQWVSYLRRADRPAFEAAARAEYPGFTIREPGPNGLIPALDHEEQTVIRLNAPLTGNEAALGYDNSRAPLGPDLKAARQLRTLRVTRQFRLAQARSPDDEKGVVFALPIFRQPTSPNDDGFRGFVQGVFRVETMLAQSHRLEPDDALLIQYRDLDATDPEQSLLYINHAGQEDRPARATPLTPPAPYLYQTEINLGGRRWEFLVGVNPVWHRQQQSLIPWLVLTSGILTTGVLLSLLNLLLLRTKEIEGQVALRTAELEGTKRKLEEDIRRRHAAERALQASEQRLEAIIDNSPAIIFVKDLAGRYVLCNRGFEQTFGRPRAEILGRTDAELFPADQAASFREQDLRTLEAGTTQEYEDVSDDSRGPRTSIVQKFPLRNVQGEIYALCGIATDITERVAAEQERIDFERKIQQTQRLESLGVLAGGIAHDFNNILTAVLGNASLIHHQLPPGTPLHTQIEQIESAARRAANLCGQMLDYAGKRQLATGKIDLSALIRDTVTLLEVSIAKNVRLHLDLAQHLPSVEADGTQVRQIVMNLVINAAESLGERGGGIHITTSLVDAAPGLFRDAIQSPELPGGRYVSFQVKDTGCGIPAETLARIFEPFFTTKFTGRGLGLSVVLGIVRSHRGALFVESEVGVGTTFRLLLPAVDDRLTASKAAPATPLTSAALPRLSGTVLIVDDEPQVRGITALALRQCGLEVLEAPEGQTALNLWAEHTKRIDLILLDLTMPVLSGEETLSRLREQGATQKVILMSGYSANEAVRRCRQLGAVEFLHKPFELATLIQLLARHLR